MRDPVFLEVEDVLLIHEEQLAKYGGAAGVRDAGLLESAVAMPRAAWNSRLVWEAIRCLPRGIVEVGVPDPERRDLSRPEAGQELERVRHPSQQRHAHVREERLDLVHPEEPADPPERVGVGDRRQVLSRVPHAWVRGDQPLLDRVGEDRLHRVGDVLQRSTRQRPGTVGAEPSQGRSRMREHPRARDRVESLPPDRGKRVERQAPLVMPPVKLVHALAASDPLLGILREDRAGPVVRDGR